MAASCFLRLALTQLVAANDDEAARSSTLEKRPRIENDLLTTLIQTGQSQVEQAGNTLRFSFCRSPGVRRQLARGSCCFFLLRAALIPFTWLPPFQYCPRKNLLQHQQEAGCVSGAISTLGAKLLGQSRCNHMAQLPKGHAHTNRLMRRLLQKPGLVSLLHLYGSCFGA